jgi:putative DNA primase/helicase
VAAAEIAARLGGAMRSGQWWRCRCPVHDSRGATLALRDGQRGLIVKCWAGCDPREVLAQVRRLGLLDRAALSPGTQQHFAVRADADARRTELFHRIWNAAQSARSDPVVRYLAARGITIAPPPSLRYAPLLRRRDGSCGPAIVARIASIDDELIGVHRTWLHRGPDGLWRRRDRAMFGRAAGGAVRLSPAAETMLIAEGIETAMAAMTATAKPAWAALSTAGMIALALPPIVRTVLILADHDVNGAGENAAQVAAARWLAEGRRVRIAIPPEPGTDFNDVLLGSAACACITKAGNVAA